MTGRTTPSTIRDTVSPTAGLFDAVLRLPDPVFAVLDGAWFDNLPNLLGSSGLQHRSLFHEAAEVELRAAGPWLVDPGGLAGVHQIEHILSLVGKRPAVVVWACPSGEAALHRHLRGLNQALFPRRSREAAGLDTDAIIEPADSTHERLLFRHWDPRVLASVAPLLDEGQSARLLGPAQGAAFDAGYGRGVSLIRRPDGLPAAALGPLRFTPNQIEILDAEYADRFRWDTVAYLRRHCAEQFKNNELKDLYTMAHMAEKSAYEVGLHTAEDIRRWSLLWVMSSAVRHNPEVQRFMLDPSQGRNASERFETIWRDTIQYLIIRERNNRQN